MNVFQEVALWMDIAGQVPSKRLKGLYFGLMMEELGEGLVAIMKANRADMAGVQTVIGKFNLMAGEFKEGLYDHDISNTDLVDLVDSAIDLMWVCAGFLHAAGVNGERAWKSVSDSNYSKFLFDGTSYAVQLDANGKVVKPEGYSAPDWSWL